MRQILKNIFTMIALLLMAVTVSAKSGTLKKGKAQMYYSYSGGSGGEVHDLPGYSPDAAKVYICNATVGSELTLSGKIKSAADKDNVIGIEVRYTDEYGVGCKSPEVYNEKNAISKTIPVPNNPKLKEVSMQVSYAGMVCIVRWKITNAPKRWVPPSSSNCDHPDSGIRFEELWGEVSFRCNDQDDSAYEYAEYQTVIKELDRIRTKEDSGARLEIPEWQGLFTIRSESTIIIKTEENNVTKLEILAGAIWGNVKKLLQGKSIELEMSNCVSGIKGTIVAFEERNGKSNVYLFAGSVEVKSKKTKKKVMLKAGQASSVGKDGQMKVQKFDIAKGAKKFGIPMKEIKNYYGNKSSASSTASQKRYGMERGVITYSFTKGDQKGTVVRTFDKYGQLERQASKVSGSSTTNVSIYRGSKGYQLDEKTKKVKQSKYAPINFLNISDADLKKHKLTKKGTATVAGKQCTVYQSSTTAYYVWNGIVLKKIVNSKNGKSVSEATKIEQPATIDENKFKVPSGYKVK